MLPINWGFLSGLSSSISRISKHRLIAVFIMQELQYRNTVVKGRDYLESSFIFDFINKAFLVMFMGHSVPHFCF